MKKEWIIGIISIVLFIILLWIFFPRTGRLTNLESCVAAGEISFDESAGESFGECCQGLTEIGNVFYSEDKTCEEIFAIVGYGSICSDCGNNICESWENRCNCPNDCQNP